MSQRVQENQEPQHEEQELLPLRPCTSCGQRFDSAYLKWGGGRWFCNDCHKRWNDDQAALPRAEGAEELAANATAKIETFNKIDAGFGYTAGVARCGGYGFGFYMATKYSFFSDLLHGVVLADILTWVMLVWFDHSFSRTGKLLEFVGFILLTTLILGGGEKMTEFESSSAMGMAFLGFLITFSTKGLYQMHRFWCHGSVESN